jgi:hypothetical protein
MITLRQPAPAVAPLPVPLPGLDRAPAGPVRPTWSWLRVGAAPRPQSWLPASHAR